MIYFYYGTDIEKTIKKSHELVDSLRKKKPDAGFFKIDSENFDSAMLEGYIGGQGLFSNKYIIFLDRLCEKKEIKDEFIDKLKEIGASENIFIILEGKIDKITAVKIEKKAEKTVKFDLAETGKNFDRGGNNAFALADAIGKRNKKEAWMLYRKAIDGGEAVEALHGMVFWKIKSLILSGGNNVWKNDELLAVLDELITIYHEARRGRYELETGLEVFILGMK
ncbi:MAG: hypothetical protein AAB683_01565 [Patescibacteria group bacterium]